MLQARVHRHPKCMLRVSASVLRVLREQVLEIGYPFWQACAAQLSIFIGIISATSIRPYSLLPLLLNQILHRTMPQRLPTNNLPIRIPSHSAHYAPRGRRECLCYGPVADLSTRIGTGSLGWTWYRRRLAHKTTMGMGMVVGGGGGHSADVEESAKMVTKGAEETRGTTVNVKPCVR